MTINLEELESDMVFLSENPSPDEVNRLAHRWLETLYELKPFQKKIESNMGIIHKRSDELLENTERLVEEMKG